MLRRMLVLAAAVSLVIVPSAFGQQYVAGSDGSGDPFFPKAGNGGYDVAHYSLALDYEGASNFLRGTAVIQATATQNLRRFNLDFRDFYAISSLTVNGAPGQHRPAWRAGGRDQPRLPPRPRHPVHGARRVRRRAEADQGPG